MLFDDLAVVALKYESVRRDFAGNNSFTKTPRSLNYHACTGLIIRITREHHTGHIGPDQLLYDYGHGHLAHALLLPIGAGSTGIERRPALLYGFDDGGFAVHAEDRLLLTGEAGGFAILGRSRGPHGHQIAAQLRIGG